MRELVICVCFFSLLIVAGCQSVKEEKKEESANKPYDLNYTGWKFIGNDSINSYGWLHDKKETIRLNFKTNLVSNSVICISKGFAIPTANERSIPKYDTLSKKSNDFSVGFAPADIQGFIRFKVYPTLKDARLDTDKLLLDVEYRIDLKVNNEEMPRKPYDLIVKKHVN